MEYKDFKQNDGTGGKPLKEPVPLPYKRNGDKIIKGEVDNNAKIVIGRDRDPFGRGKRKKKEFENFRDSGKPVKSQVSGYSDHMGAGAIDISVGSGAPYPMDMSFLDRPNNLPPLYCTERVNSLSSKKLIDKETDHPGFVMDAARIYITQMGDIDDYFDLYKVPGIDDNPSSAIIQKADRLRMHARRDVKIIAGGDGTEGVDSCGYTIKDDRAGIHLIAGNGRFPEKQQPLVLGKNLLKALQGIHNILQDVLEVQDKLVKTQMTLNTIVSNSIRVSPAGPSAPDPISQTNNLIKLISDIQDLMSIWFSKFVNIPFGQEFRFTNVASDDYILSRYNTTN